jgi:hypothetical protein
MESGKYWRLRATEMRQRAAGIKDPFVSSGFLTLAEQYERLAEDGARWLPSSPGAVPSKKLGGR